jgi:DNA polymerase III alpha subunit
MGFGTLEDLEGTFELVIFSDPYALYVNLLREAGEAVGSGRGPMPLLVSGSLEESEPPKILVREIMRLEEGEQRLTTRLRLRVLESEATCDRMEALRRVLTAHPGDCEVFVHITIPGESETIVSVRGIRGVEASDVLQRDIDALFGRSVAERGL